MSASILVVEDEPAIQELLRVNLEDAGFAVHAVADAESAQVQIKSALPDLILLDWMLPGQSGLAFARTLRGDARTRELPIIMVTARSDEADRVAGLEVWVDDYVTKPFSPRELKARIKSVLRRRAPESAQEALRVGTLELDPVTHRATAGGVARCPRPDRIPVAQISHGAARARAQPHAIARPGLGRPCLHRGAHGRCAYSPAAPCAGTCRSRANDRDGARQRLSACGAQVRPPPDDCAQAPMTPLWLRGLAVPMLVGVLSATAWLASGIVAGFVIMAAGLLATIGWHLWQLHKLAEWAAGPIDASVPEGRGTWTIAYAALYRRVRERSARQRDLRLALDRFVSGAEALPEGVVVLDANDRIRWANPRAQAHLGIDLRQDLGAPIANLVRQPAFVLYLASGDFHEPVVFQSIREGASTLSVQIVPFGVEEKLLMSRDVTRLEAVARVRRDFIANVSHELKTPLTVLTGFLETFADVELEKKQRLRYLALMQEQAKNMQRLVDDLLTLSSLESDQNITAESEFAIVPLLLESSSDAKALSGGRQEVTLDHRRCGDGTWQPRRAGQRIRQSREQRRALYTGRRTHRAGLAGDRSRRRIQRDRHRHRHLGRAYSEIDRALLSRRSQPITGHRGHRTRSRDRQTRADPASGRTDHRE